MSSKRNPNLACPMVMKPFEEYISPVTEKQINTREERREDMKKADAVDPRDLK